MARTVICPHCEAAFEITNEITDREREVALLAAKGMKGVNIGKKLYISEKTVKNHLSSVYLKLSMVNRIDLMKYFIQSGEMSVDEINIHVEREK
jgi:two-component system response regulator DegU